MKYIVEWYVDSRDDSTYIGENEFTGTYADCEEWAFFHADGFEYRIVARG